MARTRCFERMGRNASVVDMTAVVDYVTVSVLEVS